MPLALITAHNASKPLAEFAGLLSTTHTLMATAATRHYLKGSGVHPVLPASEICAPFSTTVDSSMFEMVDAGLYHALTRGHPVGTSTGTMPIDFVVADFKPAGRPDDPDGLPDLDRLALAEAAAVAVLYHRQLIYVLAGTGLDADAYRAMWEDYAGKKNQQVFHACRAVEAIAAYRRRLLRLLV